MSDELNVKISEIKAKFIRKAAENVDKFGSGSGARDGKIDAEEAKTLAALLNGDLSKKKNQKKLEKESDEVKAIFGFTSTIAAKTEAETVQEAAKPAEAKKSPVDEVFDAYKKARGYDPEKGGRLKDEAGNDVPEKTVKAAYKEVEAQFENKGKEYKAALKDLKKYAKHIDAHFVAQTAVKESDATTSKQVKADAEETLKERNNGKMDKWEKHALHNTDRKITSKVLSYLSGRNSAMKELRKDVAAGNKAADVVQGTYSQKDFADAIGKKSPLVKQNIVIEDENGNKKTVNALEAAGLIEDKGNGQYSIEKLSALVKLSIGADNTANREEHKGESEIEKVKDNLRSAGVDVGRITDRDIRQLIEFCGYRVQHKNQAGVIYDTLIGGALAGASGAISAATNPRDIARITVDVDQHVQIPINLGSEQFVKDFMDSVANNAEFQSILGSTGSVVSNGAEILISIDQIAKVEQVMKFTKHILTTATKGAIIGAGLGLLKGLTDYGPSEEGIFPTNIDCTTYEGMVRIINGRLADKIITEEQAIALRLLAVEFIKTTKDANGVEKAVTEDVNGNCEMVMDCQGFLNKLHKAAGNDKLNSAELAAVAKKYDNPFEVEKTDKIPCDEAPAEERIEEPVEQPVVEPEVKPEVKYYDSGYKEVRKTKKFESWGELASRYDCLEGDFNPKFNLNYNPKTKTFNPNSYARTMMKVMQAFIAEDNVYDFDRLKELTDAAERGDFKTLREAKDFNYKTYMDLRGNKRTNTFGYGRQIIPDITIKDGNNEIITCEPRKEAQYKENVSAGGSGRKTNIGGKDSGFVRSEDGQIDVKVDNKKDYNEAVEKAEKANYKKR